MKELSIEEKAKAYDEAMKRIENIKTGKCETTFMFTEGLFEHIFPELKESEDERMIQYFKDLAPFDKADELYEKYGFSHKDAIAWLEKQNSNVDNANKEYWRGYREGKQEILDKYAELEKQGEQKPVISNDALREGIAHFGITQYQIDNWLKKYVDVEKQGEQKTADKAESNLLTVERAKEMSPFMRSGFENEYAAWSEEDERYLSYAIHAVEDMLGNNGRNTVTWLKSLKPQSKWKPSEEQITWLYRATDEVRKDSRMKQVLNGLLCDLKKLREE